MDLRKGMNWNDTRPSRFTITFNEPNDMPDIRDSSFDIAAGLKIKISVNAIKVHSDILVKTVPAEKRSCKFSEENNTLSIFKWYSR